MPKHRSHLTTLAIILILGLMIPFFVYMSAQAQDPNQWQTFFASSERFSFQYPPEWNATEEFGMIFVANVEDPAGYSGELDAGEFFVFFVLPANTQSVFGIDSQGSPALVMEQFLIETASNVVTYGDPEAVIVSDTVGVRVELRDFETEGYIYMIDAGEDTVMVAAAIAPLGEFDQYTETAFGIINSIRFGEESLAGGFRASSPTPPPLPQATFNVQQVTLTPSGSEENALFERVTLTPQNTANFEQTIVALESTITVLETNPTAIDSETAPDCEIYVVQAGDILSDVAARYNTTVEQILAINPQQTGQILTAGSFLYIPSETCVGGSPPPTPTFVPPATLPPTFTPIPTVVSGGAIQIVSITERGNVSREVVEIRNVGSPAILNGWTLSDDDGNIYTFTDAEIQNNATIRLYSRNGRDTPVDFYWDRTQYVWDAGDLVTLRDSAGNVVASFVVN